MSLNEYYRNMLCAFLGPTFITGLVLSTFLFYHATIDLLACCLLKMVACISFLPYAIPSAASRVYYWILVGRKEQKSYLIGHFL